MKDGVPILLPADFSTQDIVSIGLENECRKMQRIMEVILPSERSEVRPKEVLNGGENPSSPTSLPIDDETMWGQS
jgi:hypothetical protein